MKPSSFIIIINNTIITIKRTKKSWNKIIKINEGKSLYEHMNEVRLILTEGTY